MAQLFGPRANTIGRIALCAIILVPIAALAVHVLLMYSPYLTGLNHIAQQPVPFSHKHHVTEDGIDCRYCHYDVERSALAGIPPTQVCMSCHSQLWKDAPMLAPVRASFASGIPLHWHQVNQLPDYVFFDHSIHIAKGIGCTTCHGPIQDMPLVRQGQRLTMDWCLSCHRNPGPNLRPPDQVFALNWQPNSDSEKIRRLLIYYKLHTQHLTDCSTCHR